MGVIPLKIQGEMSTVGSASHRWMRGNKAPPGAINDALQASKRQ